MIGRARRRIERLLAVAGGNYNLIFVCVVAASVGSSVFTINYLRALDDTFSGVYENDVIGQDLVENAHVQLLLVDISVKDAIINEDNTGMDVYAARMAAGTDRMRKALEKAVATFKSPAGKELAAAARKDLAEYVRRAEALETRMRTDGYLAASDTEALSVYKDRLLGDYRKLNQTKSANERKAFNAISAQLRFALAVTVAMLVGSVAMRVVLHVRDRKKRKAAGR